MKEGPKDKKFGTIQGQDVKFGRCVVSRERASIVGAISQLFAKASFGGFHAQRIVRTHPPRFPAHRAELFGIFRTVNNTFVTFGYIH